MPKPWEKYGGVQTKPADPMLGSKTTQARNQADASALDPARARADLQGQNISNALNELNIRGKKQELDAAAAKEADRQADLKRETDAKAANIYKVGRAISLLDSLQNDAADNGGFGETGKSGEMSRKYLGSGYAGYDLAGKIKGIRGINFIESIKQLKAASPNGSTGAGGLTETEGQKLEDAIGVLDPNLSQDEFLNQLKIARDTYLDSYRRLGGNDPKIDPSLAHDAPPPDNMKLSKGGTRSEIDPMRKAVMARVGQMVAQPNPDRKQVEQFIRDNDMEPGSFNLQELFRYRASPDFIRWQRENPGKPFLPAPSSYTHEVPLSGTANAMNKVAQSAPGAFFASSANALSGGHLDDLGGESVNTGLQLMQAEHPGASFLGDVSGQALFEAGAGRIPGLSAMRGARFGQLGMDALYGGYAGSGSEQGGILSGAAGNAAGGGLLRGVSRAAGSALKGVTNPNLRYLDQRNVPLTVGQIGRGSDSVVGNAVGGLEDRAAGVPIFDAIINSARKRGEVGFNHAAFREAGGSGATGAAGIGELGDKVNNAYSFLDGANMPLDAKFAAAQAGVRAGLPNLPAFGPEIGRGMDTLDRASAGGVLGGRDWQSGVRSTRANRASIAGQPFADEAASSLGDIQDNLMGLAERQGPAGTLDSLTSANRLNGQYQTILGALDNGPAQARGELFAAKGLDAASRQGARNFGGRAASMRGERPFYDLTTAGMDVMPNQVPDSGTAGRALMYSTLFGAGLGSGLGGAAAAGGDAGDGATAGGMSGAVTLPFVLAALYTKKGQKGLQKALLGPRSKQAEEYGRALLDPRVQRIFGSLGSGTARDLFLNPELKK